MAAQRQSHNQNLSKLVMQLQILVGCFEEHNTYGLLTSHFDRTTLVNKGFTIWDKTPKHDKFSLQDKARIPGGQDSSILPARVANCSARFGSSCPLAELSYNKA